MTIRVVLTDDLEMHRSMLKMNLSTYSRDHPETALEIIGECENGALLVEQVAVLRPDWIFLDIRMPTMDGLTALLHLRRRCDFTGPVVMASSEDEANIARFFKGTVSDKVKAMSFEQKCGHMAKVEERVLAGQREEGKINDLLPGCEKLHLDPIEYAKHIGANGFLHKPYAPDQVDAVLGAVVRGSGFTSTR